MKCIICGSFTYSLLGLCKKCYRKYKKAYCKLIVSSISKEDLRNKIRYLETRERFKAFAYIHRLFKFKLGEKGLNWLIDKAKLDEVILLERSQLEKEKKILEAVWERVDYDNWESKREALRKIRSKKCPICFGDKSIGTELCLDCSNKARSIAAKLFLDIPREEIKKRNLIEVYYRAKYIKALDPFSLKKKLGNVFMAKVETLPEKDKVLIFKYIKVREKR